MPPRCCDSSWIRVAFASVAQLVAAAACTIYAFWVRALGLDLALLLTVEAEAAVVTTTVTPTVAAEVIAFVEAVTTVKATFATPTRLAWIILGLVIFTATLRLWSRVCEAEPC
jgi:hypothetical protein